MFKLLEHKTESSASELVRKQTCISSTTTTADRGVLCDFTFYLRTCVLKELSHCIFNSTLMKTKLNTYRQA